MPRTACGSFIKSASCGAKINISALVIAPTIANAGSATRKYLAVWRVFPVSFDAEIRRESATGIPE
jgi:hypothetical protein